MPSEPKESSTDSTLQDSENLPVDHRSSPSFPQPPVIPPVLTREQPIPSVPAAPPKNLQPVTSPLPEPKPAPEPTLEPTLEPTRVPSPAPRLPSPPPLVTASAPPDTSNALPSDIKPVAATTASVAKSLSTPSAPKAEKITPTKEPIKLLKLPVWLMKHASTPEYDAAKNRVAQAFKTRQIELEFYEVPIVAGAPQIPPEHKHLKTAAFALYFFKYLGTNAGRPGFNELARILHSIAPESNHHAFLVFFHPITITDEQPPAEVKFTDETPVGPKPITIPYPSGTNLNKNKAKRTAINIGMQDTAKNDKGTSVDIIPLIDSVEEVLPAEMKATLKKIRRQQGK